jgi:GNAT superfamily N-acetyltransferase
MQKIILHTGGPDDITRLRALAQEMKLSKESDYFELQMEYVQAGERLIYIAVAEGRDAGYCVLNWQPKYTLFKKLSLPEIQDINVLSAFRRRGIGRSLIEHCEETARAKGCTQMGIGVGLNPGFGAAQRLYVKMGYIPDGNGVNYDRQPVGNGEMRPLDDYLCLMMVKEL